MGSMYIRETISSHTPSLLLYGPKGCGKTQLVRAIATHLNAIIIDLSPFTIQGIYEGEKNGHLRLLYSAFKVAREFQPAIVYIDECDQIFSGAKKGKKGKKKKAKKGEGGSAARMKKDLVTYKKLLKPKDRATVGLRHVCAGRFVQRLGKSTSEHLRTNCSSQSSASSSVALGISSSDAEALHTHVESERSIPH